MNITIENFRVTRRRTDPPLLANCAVMAKQNYSCQTFVILLSYSYLDMRKLLRLKTCKAPFEWKLCSVQCQIGPYCALQQCSKVNLYHHNCMTWITWKCGLEKTSCRRLISSRVNRPLGHSVELFISVYSLRINLHVKQKMLVPFPVVFLI